LLESWKVAARGHISPAYDVVAALRPFARHHKVLLPGEHRYCGGSLDPFSEFERIWLGIVPGFVVASHRGADRLSNPVNHDVRQQRVLCEAGLYLAAAV